MIGTTRSGLLPDFSHANLSVVPMEATDSATAVARIFSLTDNIDLLVNNAGTAPDVFAVVPDYETFTQTINTNITGVVFFTEPLLERIHEGGQVVFISSNMGLPRNAAPNGPGYRLSKAAINMYASMLATRLADKGIRVTPFHPGWVQTKLGGDQATINTSACSGGALSGHSDETESGKFWDITIPGIDPF